MSTPHNGRQDRYSSEGRGGVAGTDELAEMRNGAADPQSERYQGNYPVDEPGVAESGRAEEPAAHDPFNSPADPGPGYVYGHSAERPSAEGGPEPPYQAPSPSGWEPPRAEPPSPPLPADLMPGFGQAYPGAASPPPPSPGPGQPGSDEFGGAGSGLGGSSEFRGSDYGYGARDDGRGDFGRSGEYSSPDPQFGHAPGQAFGQQDDYRPDVAQTTGQAFEGGAEPDYRRTAESFGSSHSGFGTPGFQDDATAGMPAAPPDVPIPPTPSEPVHDYLSGLADVRDRPSRSAVGTQDHPTLTTPGVRGGVPPRRSPSQAATARMPRPRVRTPGAQGLHGREAHVTVARVEPMSVMKFSFVVSVVAFIVLFVAVAVLYGVLAGLGVFDSLERTIASLTSGQGSSGVNAAQWFSASRILGYAALFGALNIVLITALSTVGAVLYNAATRLIGGVEITLNETE